MFRTSPRDRVSSLLLVMCACHLGCSSSPEGESRVVIQTSALSAAQTGDQVPHEYTVQLRSLSQQVVTTGLGLTLEGLVASPVRDGIALQATDVVWIDDTVYASYNVAGDTFLGALQVIDASDPSDPKVVVEATYPTADIAKLQVSGSKIFAAAADAQFGGTLEFFSYENGSLSYDGYSKVGSYAGTFVARDQYQVLVSSGDRGGGLSRFDVSSGMATLSQSLPLEDARWVGALDEGAILAVSGSPGAIVRYTPNTTGGYDAQSVPIELASQGAPSWAGRQHDLFYMASNESGLEVYDLRTMQRVGQLTSPGTANGLAIGTDEKLAFLADGEAGIRVIDVLDPTDPLELASLDVEDSGSANAVALHAEHLALADGRGGVKLLKYQRSVAQPDDCDGDGALNADDDDDDDDGVLDMDDEADCDPDIVCDPNKLDATGPFIGDLYELPCASVPAGLPSARVPNGTVPGDFDWFSSKYFAFKVQRDNLLINNSEKYFTTKTSSCSSPYSYTEHWYTTALATETGTYSFEMSSNGDSWFYVDGNLVVNLSGRNANLQGPVDVQLAAGAHRFDIYVAEVQKVLSGAVFHAVGGPSPKARLEFEQHVCLEKDADADADGLRNGSDMAPLERP